MEATVAREIQAVAGSRLDQVRLEQVTIIPRRCIFRPPSPRALFKSFDIIERSQRLVREYQELSYTVKTLRQSSQNSRYTLVSFAET